VKAGALIRQKRTGFRWEWPGLLIGRRPGRAAALSSLLDRLFTQGEPDRSSAEQHGPPPVDDLGPEGMAAPGHAGQDGGGAFKWREYLDTIQFPTNGVARLQFGLKAQGDRDTTLFTAYRIAGARL